MTAAPPRLRRRLGVVSRSAIYDQRIKLAGLNVDEVVKANSGGTANVSREVTQAIKESFVRGFRIVMLIAAGMALAGSLTSFLLIENKKP
jgi:hypothetical protein